MFTCICTAPKPVHLPAYYQAAGKLRVAPPLLLPQQSIDAGARLLVADIQPHADHHLTPCAARTMSFLRLETEEESISFESIS